MAARAYGLDMGYGSIWRFRMGIELNNLHSLETVSSATYQSITVVLFLLVS